MTGFRELYWNSPDQLRLFARVYDGPDPSAPTVLCLPGLRRSSRDFEDLALHLQSRFNVVAPDLRGRGLSARDRHVTNYQPNVYVHDVLRLLALLQRPRVIVLGTALGGIVGMMLAAAQPTLVTGLMLNDIGPEVDPAGAERILRLITNRQMPEDWVEATHCIKALYAHAWPDLTPERWLTQTRRTFRQDAQGKPVIDCDPMVADLTRQRSASEVDLWPLWRTLTALPVLTIHGARSDVLSSDIVARMSATHPGMGLVTLANRGHFPLLDEPPALAAIDRFLDEVPKTCSPELPATASSRWPRHRQRHTTALNARQARK